MKDYDVYLFDWDGTLARTLEMWLDILHTEFTARGIQGLSDEQIVHLFGTRFAESVVEYGIKQEDGLDFEEVACRRAAKGEQTVELYPGSHELLQTLNSSGKKLGLITANWRENTLAMLKNHDLTDVFDVIITSNEVKHFKPDPEGILLAIEQLGADKEQTVMIGDSAKDMGAAQNAGIDRVLVYPPSHQLFYDLDELIEHKPIRVVDDLAKILV